MLMVKTGVVVVFDPDLSNSEKGRLLGSPTLAQNTPEVNAEWQRIVVQNRSRFAQMQARDAVTGNVDEDTAWIEEEYAHWMGADSQILRTEMPDIYLYSLASERDGLADDYLGVPGHDPRFTASEMLFAPAVFFAFTGDEVWNEPPSETQIIEALKVDLSSAQALVIADRLQALGQDLVGRRAFESLLRRTLEGPARVQAFAQAQNALAANFLPDFGEATFTLPRGFDTAIFAASMVRWLRFWASRGVNFRHTVFE